MREGVKIGISGGRPWRQAAGRPPNILITVKINHPDAAGSRLLMAKEQKTLKIDQAPPARPEEKRRPEPAPAAKPAAAITNAPAPKAAEKPADRGIAKAEKGKDRRVIEAISEGRKLEAYTEHRTKDMHACFLCDSVCYRKKTGKMIGKRWICMDCLRQIKETMENFKQWEEEIALERQMKKQLDDGLGC